MLLSDLLSLVTVTKNDSKFVFLKGLAIYARYLDVTVYKDYC